MQSRLRSWGVLAALLTLGASVHGLSAAPPPERFAITNAKIIPVVGAEIEKGTIVVERGKIVAVGPAKDVTVPFDAREFDGTGKVIMPGMINAHTTDGLDIPNESRSIVPQLDVADALDPSALAFEDSLRRGITTVHVAPGNDTVIGGFTRVVRPIGRNVAELSVEPGYFQKLSVSPRSTLDRMTQLAELREAFAELKDYMARRSESKYEEKLKEDEKEIDVVPAEARKRGRDMLEADDIDDQHRNLLRLIGGQIEVEGGQTPRLFEPCGAFIWCERATDVGPAVKVAKDNGFFDRTVLVLGPECYKAVPELKAAARPVVLSPDLVYRERNPFTGEETETFVPRKIADAGLIFAVVPGPADSLAERMLTYQAARCVRAGLSRDVAFQAITLNPAKILGVADRMGSVEVGKTANLVMFSGDPLEFDSVVEMCFIDGIPAYERSKDIRLKRLLSTAPTPTPEQEGRRD